MKKLRNILRNYAEDIFIITGLILINLATFRLSITAGLYSVGFSLIALGVVIARQPPRRG